MPLLNFSKVLCFTLYNSEEAKYMEPVKVFD